MSIEVELYELICGTCGCPHAIPKALYDTMKREGGYWQCPTGHARGFKSGDAEAKLEAAIEAKHAAERRITSYMNRCASLERRLAAQKAATTRAKRKSKC